MSLLPLQSFRRALVAVAVVALGVAGVAPAPASADSPTYVLDNGRLRFGGGGHLQAAPANREASIDERGNLRQPYYWSSLASRWNKLTYSSYPLNLAVGSGTGGNWSGSQVVEDPSLTGQTIDGTGFISASSESGAEIGSGWLRSTGTISLGGGREVEISNTYELGATASFVKVTTAMRNVEGTTIDNVNLWVGTKDDFVGENDDPTKTKGNLVDGIFVPTSDTAMPGAALQITSGAEGVLFYSTTPDTNTSISNCCSFNNAYNANPTSSPTTMTGDGSYALHLPVGGLAAGASAEIVWYYAAGTLAELADVVRQVADAAAPPRPVAVVGNGQITLQWEQPASDESITGYVIHYRAEGEADWIELPRRDATAPLTEVISGLDNGTTYRFEIRAVTGAGETEAFGDWSPTSDIAIPGTPRSTALPTITGDAVVGETLTVLDPDGAWVNNGTEPMTSGYRWQADGIDIPGATGPTLLVTADLVGKRLRAVATRTNEIGATDAFSAAAAKVPAIPRLLGLSVSTGELTPAFDDDVRELAVALPEASDSLALDWASVPGATVTVDGEPTSAPHTLTVAHGATTVRIEVSLGGQVASYTLRITRAAPVVASPPATTPPPPAPRPAPAAPPAAVRPVPPVLGLGAGTGTGTGTGTGGAAATPTALYISTTGTATEVQLPPRAPARNVSAAVAVSPTESIAVNPGGQLFVTNPAHDFGQVPATVRLNAPITNIGLQWRAPATSADASDQAAGWVPSGYWMAAADGGVFNFGEAGFHGSMGAAKLNEPVVGIAPTRSGEGYWLVAADGGVFNFGNAAFFGSLGNLQLNEPIVSIVPTSTGGGYWLIGADGGVFTFGDATFLGSGSGSGRRFIGAAPTLSGAGYWLVGDDRKLLALGDAGKEQ